MIEVWKDIQGYEGLYAVSNFGNVKNIVSDKTLKKLPSKAGYLTVALYKNKIPKRCTIHRLVAKAFIPNPDEKETVNHIDGDKHNNIVANLEWATRAENNIHAYITGLKIGINHKNNKSSMPIEQYDKEMHLIRVYPSMNEAGRNGFSVAEICKCCKGKSKTHHGYIWKYA